MKSDREIIAELEEITGRKLQVVGKDISLVNYNKPGVHYEDDRVIKLSLYNYGLKSLPEIVTELRSLRRLYVVQNNLTALPEAIGNLEFLRHLWLTYNKLEKLPYSIGDLRSLEYLNLGRNNLKTLPISIGNLKSLKILLISSNNIETLPVSFLNLESLRSINIANNPILEGEYFGNLAAHYDIDFPKIFQFLRRKRQDEIEKFKKKFEENEKKYKKVADGFIVDFR
ncbi:MAG: hypothetical protein GF329_06335 [Candidatus Lokiarchaeota archaeon]|nr:hypothetical protein [Candidatus Lokiarchaeota archaeon]